MESMKAALRYSRELEELKLHVNPQAAGRLTLVGAINTFWDISFPWRPIFLVPFAVYAWLGCSNQLPLTFFSGAAPTAVCKVYHDWVLGYRIVWTYMCLELAFYILMNLKLKYLQSKDPLEASLNSASILSFEERRLLWDRVIQAESGDIAAYFEGWFCGTCIEDISTHEIENYITWKYFDGRFQEHLNQMELDQLDKFVEQTRKLIRKEKRKSLRKSLIRKLSQSSISSDISNASTSNESTKTLEHEWRVFEAQKLVMERSLTKGKDIPKKQVAQIMRKVTESHQLFKSQTQTAVSGKSRRFHRPTADPLLGVRIAPLIFHLLCFVITGVVLPIVLRLLGFQRHRACSVPYYFHPGKQPGPVAKSPTVFIHGIGIGPIIYLSLIFKMLITGRPIFIPEVEAVSAFRPWVFPSALLTPEQVATAMSAMLAAHGYTQAVFVGHSFGTFWMTYVIKEAPYLVAGLVFLDPACFNLHNSTLCRRFVYDKPDPGDTGYQVKCDMMVNYAIQRTNLLRSNLLLEELTDAHNKKNGPIPACVFLSGKDRLAPSDIQRQYLQQDPDCAFLEANKVTDGFFDNGNLNVVVFPGVDHGMWLLQPQTSIPLIVDAVNALSRRSG